jgi:phosphoglycolate phosphatase
LTPDEIRQLVGEGVEILLDRCFAPAAVPPGAAGLFEGRYDEICCEQSRMLDDVESTIEALASREVRMGVCTNKPTGFSRKILDYLGIADHFRAIVGPDLAGARKPAAEHVRFTMRAMPAVSGETLFVGDMPIDVEAARNAGLAVAVIATGSSSLEGLRAARPDFVLDRFSDLLELAGSEIDLVRR